MQTKKNKSLYKKNGKTLMITGGTGNFDNAALNMFLKTNIGAIRIFSRDEKKHNNMHHIFQVKMPKVAEKIRLYIGDIRSFQFLKMHDAKHLAATEFDSNNTTILNLEEKKAKITSPQYIQEKLDEINK